MLVAGLLGRVVTRTSSRQDIGPRELSVLIISAPDLDAEAWERHATVSDPSGSPATKWLWELVRQRSQEEKSKFLHLVRIRAAYRQAASAR